MYYNYAIAAYWYLVLFYEMTFYEFSPLSNEKHVVLQF